MNASLSSSSESSSVHARTLDPAAATSAAGVVMTAVGTAAAGCVSCGVVCGPSILAAIGLSSAGAGWLAALSGLRPWLLGIGFILTTSALGRVYLTRRKTTAGRRALLWMAVLLTAGLGVAEVAAVARRPAAAATVVPASGGSAPSAGANACTTSCDRPCGANSATE